MIRLLYIGNKLAKHGKNPTSIDVMGPLLENEGYSVVYASDKKNMFFRLMHMLWKAISTKADYVLIDTYSTRNFWYAFLVSQICRLTNKKYIPICRGGNLPQRVNKNLRMSRMIFNHSLVNIAPSEYTYEMLQEVGVGNLELVPNSLPLDQYEFFNRTNFEPNFLWVRSLNEIYNPLLMIDAFAKVKKELPNAKLCMVGPEGNLKIEDLKAYGISKGVEIDFKGRLSKAEWIALSKQYSVFVNTTNVDNMPVSVMEAMALGLVVISTKVGGIPFMIKDRITGRLVNKGDARELSCVMHEIIQEEQASKQMVQGARSYVEQLDWDIVKNQWLNLLK